MLPPKRQNLFPPFATTFDGDPAECSKHLGRARGMLSLMCRSIPPVKSRTETTADGVEIRVTTNPNHIYIKSGNKFYATWVDRTTTYGYVYTKGYQLTAQQALTPIDLATDQFGIGSVASSVKGGVTPAFTPKVYSPAFPTGYFPYWFSTSRTGLISHFFESNVGSINNYVITYDRWNYFISGQLFVVGSIASPTGKIVVIEVNGATNNIEVVIYAKPLKVLYYALVEEYRRVVGYYGLSISAYSAGLFLQDKTSFIYANYTGFFLIEFSVDYLINSAPVLISSATGYTPLDGLSHVVPLVSYGDVIEGSMVQMMNTTGGVWTGGAYTFDIKTFSYDKITKAFVEKDYQNSALATLIKVIFFNNMLLGIKFYSELDSIGYRLIVERAGTKTVVYEVIWIESPGVIHPFLVTFPSKYAYDGKILILDYNTHTPTTSIIGDKYWGKLIIDTSITDYLAYQLLPPTILEHTEVANVSVTTIPAKLP